ncbi:MAG: LysR family transcriptional regulator [Bdellovibrionales bacterium]|nr:LysR family transcriptional regulator [Bdellovibrionales bacterium]
MISNTDLEYFIEIAKSGHISRAAERLGVTQPSLSHCVKRMEQALGLQLFFRSKKGVELTPSGQRLYEEADRLKDAWEQVVRSTHDEVELPQGLIRLGCHTAVAQYSLPLFLPKLATNYPDIRIRLNHGLSRHLVEAVITSKIDAAIAVNPIEHNDLIIKELCTDLVTLWAPKKCVNAQLLMLAPELLQTQEILRKLSQKKITFKNHLESSSLEVIAQLLLAGVGCAILPKRVVDSLQTKTASIVKNAPVYKDRICLVYKPEFRRVERGRVFIKLVSNCFK